MHILKRYVVMVRVSIVVIIEQWKILVNNGNEKQKNGSRKMLGFIFGLIIGFVVAITVFTACVVSSETQTDSYKQGYEVGYAEGSKIFADDIK